MSAEPAPPAGPRPAPNAVLIVDDDAAVRLVIARLLHSMGYEALSATDGYEAIRLLQRVRPALVICDRQMPGMDGLETLRWIGGSVPGLPVVLMSGSATQEDIDAAHRLGVAAFLAKPFDLETFQKAVHEVLRVGGSR